MLSTMLSKKIVVFIFIVFTFLCVFSCSDKQVDVEITNIRNCDSDDSNNSSLCEPSPKVSCILPEIESNGVCILMPIPEPIYRPSEGEAVIYYNRRDKQFDGWVLHLWNDCSAEESGSWDGSKLTSDYEYEGDATNWPEGPAPNYSEFANGEIDPIYGIFWVLKLEENSDCGNFIIHNEDGTIQTEDFELSFSNGIEDENKNIGWVLVDTTESQSDLKKAKYDTSPLCIDDVCAPYIAPRLVIENFEAHWIDRESIVWEKELNNVVLYTSPDASLIVSDGRVLESENRIELSPQVLSTENITKYPHLAEYNTYKINLDLPQIRELLKHQLYLVGEDNEGNLYGTKVQSSLVLDDIYTSTETDADEYQYGPVYHGDPTDNISVGLWAPTATDVKLLIYEKQAGTYDFTLIETEAMNLIPETGVWQASGNSQWDKKFYRFLVTVFNPFTNSIQSLVVQDPWSVSTSINGLYSQFISLDDPALKPDGWDDYTVPTVENIEASSIYEGHIRDFSIQDESTVSEYRGKYLAFTQEDSDPVRHLQALQYSGLTHFHILPMYDIASIDEDPTKQINLDNTVGEFCDVLASPPAWLCVNWPSSEILKTIFESFPDNDDSARKLVALMKDLDGFNWGYDPVFYNVPEGSYATNPHGEQRIIELRQMIQALHQMGLRTVMDVVYNHTSDSGVSSPKAVFDKIVPGYYFRRNVITGAVENASCCNDTASEHRMMAKLVKDSLLLWSKYYHIDAFRFDVMSLMPKSLITDSLALIKDIDPDVYFYGEGWNMPLSTANDAIFARATQDNMTGTGVGTFNDRMRDPMRYLNIINGESLDRIRTGLAGNLANYELLNRNGTLIKGLSVGAYTSDPQESINYVEKHDNETLWDWIHQPGNLPADINLNDRVRIQNLTQALVLYSQGVPFIHMGSELLRSKSMDGNSYNSGDWFNYVDFTKKRSNWAMGLPPEGGNKANDIEIAEAFSDPESLPGSDQIQFASEIFKEILSVSHSSALFSLHDEQEVVDRVGFHNLGKSETSNLIVMSINDGEGIVSASGLMREDLDEQVDAIVVVFNGNATEVDFALAGAEGFTLHPLLKNSFDNRVRLSSFTQESSNDDGVNGIFHVPAYTAAVFVKVQNGGQGPGLSPPNLEEMQSEENTNDEVQDESNGVPDPYKNTDVFLRGEMNAWGTTDLLEFQGNATYATSLSLKKGAYAFKFATEDWSTVNLGADSTAIVLLNETVSALQGAQTNFTIDILEDGEYLFVIEFRGQMPYLKVVHID